MYNMAKWDEAKSKAFWAERVFQAIVRDDNIANHIQTRNTQIDSRQQLQALHKQEFQDKFHTFLSSNQSCKLPGPVIAQNIRFWIEHLSWTYCNKCKLLKMEHLFPNYFKRPEIKFSKECTCTKNVYMNPNPQKIADVLKGLAQNEIIVLRPFTVHIGDCEIYTKNASSPLDTPHLHA